MNRTDVDKMERCLPASVGRTATRKSQLLCTLEVLRLLTDESHGLRADEIASIVERRTGSRPSEQKVLDDVHEIAACAPLGMEIVTPRRGESGGFRCRRSLLSSAQVRFLTDMVMTCKFATEPQRAELREALSGLASRYERDEAAHDVFVDGRDAPLSNDVFVAIDVAAQAIREARRLRFRYVSRGFYNEDVPLVADDGSQSFEETPVQLIYSFGEYYLETWAGEQDGHRALRRLDRVRAPMVSNTPAYAGEEVDRLRATVAERTTQVFDMLGDGVARTLFLEIDASVVRYAFDRFGPTIAFRDIRGNRACTKVTVQLSPTFYRWLFGMGDGMRLVKPRDEIWEGQFWDAGDKGRPSHERLVDDYEAAVRGLREQVALVCRAYGWEAPADDA